jgi:hypothetical protein
MDVAKAEQSACYKRLIDEVMNQIVSVISKHENALISLLGLH